MKQKLIDYVVSELNWDPMHVDLGLRANFCCEYCNKNLIESVDNHYDWQKDHIKPTKLAGTDDLDNFALSCRQCNFIKRGTWNESLEEKDRNERIRYFKNEIFLKRKKKQRELECLIQAINEYT